MRVREDLRRGIVDAEFRRFILESALAVWQEFLLAKNERRRINADQLGDLVAQFTADERVRVALPEFVAADSRARIRALLDTGGCFYEEARRQEARAMSATLLR